MSTVLFGNLSLTTLYVTTTCQTRTVKFLIARGDRYMCPTITNKQDHDQIMTLAT